MTKSAYRVSREAPTSGTAAILFFTGVRYARMPDVDPALVSVTPPRRRSTKPRRLVMSDDMKRA